MGYAAFPDMVILDKEFTGKDDNMVAEIDKLYCCVEAKKVQKKNFWILRVRYKLNMVVQFVFQIRELNHRIGIIKY